METKKKLRLIGIDAARGIALLGMMAIHVLPGWNEDFQPTLVWTVFSGTSAALFATLAGVSLGFLSGGAVPVTGKELKRVRTALAVRAVVIALIGLLIAYLDPPAAIILAYYGTLFLLAIPMIGWGARKLAVAAVVFAVLGPVLMQTLRGNLPEEDGYDPRLGTLLTDPGGTISTLLFTGTYPAVPWMAFICAGLVISRLDLKSVSVQFRLLVGGAGLAFGSWLLSTLLMGPFGGRERILEANRRWLDAEDVSDILIWGPDPALSDTTGWWLAVLSPYSSMPLELLNTSGLAVAAIGAMLLLAGRIDGLLTPLAAAGSMTLTLYSAHLLVLATGFLEGIPVANFIIQAAVLVLFAIVWRNSAGGQGPLERLVGRTVARVLEWFPSMRTGDSEQSTGTTKKTAP